MQAGSSAGPWSGGAVEGRCCERVQWRAGPWRGGAVGARCRERVRWRAGLWSGYEGGRNVA
eukprot:366427-Chlamydomonas_euryale.AAC.7